MGLTTSRRIALGASKYLSGRSKPDVLRPGFIGVRDYGNTTTAMQGND